MGEYYHARTGDYCDTETLPTFESGTIASGTITAVNSESIELGDRATLRLTATVDTIHADDDLAIAVQGSQDGSTWFTIGTFTTVDGAAGSESRVYPCARYVRIAFQKTGTNGAASASVTGEAV